jgi:asparagine synthase (glutamine-hydrolysing)
VALRSPGFCPTATLVSWPQLHSFSIGLEHSPDLLAARKTAHYLATVHHEYVFTVQEGLDAIPEVIYHLETYDVTTVRASTPMYLLSRKIKATGVKMVLSGEGSDEILGGGSCSCMVSDPLRSERLHLGYLYFHAAPDAKSFHQEAVRRVKNLHTSDCLRANKCGTALWYYADVDAGFQVDYGLGPGGPCSFPRQGFP